MLPSFGGSSSRGGSRPSILQTVARVTGRPARAAAAPAAGSGTPWVPRQVAPTGGQAEADTARQFKGWMDYQREHAVPGYAVPTWFTRREDFPQNLPQQSSLSELGYQQSPLMSVQTAVPFIVSMLDDALKRPVPEQQQGEWSPPDPLGFLPGGSNALWGGGRFGNGETMTDWAARNVPPAARAVWDAGARLGVNLSTPMTEQRAERKADQQRREAVASVRQWNRGNEEFRSEVPEGLPRRKERIRPITEAQWQAMTPAQQNAVMFNTNLVDAVRVDRRNQGSYSPTPAERKAYDATLQDVFGTTVSEAPKGIEYAPATVALLKELDTLPEQELGTLDDYLRLDTAITAKQVDRIEKALQPNVPEHLVPQNELTPAQERLSIAQNLTRAQGALTERLGEELERGKRLLADTSSLKLAETALELGGIDTTPQTPQLNDVEATALNDYLSYLAAPSNDIQAGLAALPGNMAKRGIDEAGQQRLYDAMLDVTRKAMAGGSWFDDQAEEWGGVRNPQAVADALGATFQKVG